MFSKIILGHELYQIVQWAVLYSLLGWMLESTYMSFCNKKLTNRGFAFLPFCPIYAVGALSVYFVLRPFQGNYIALYFLGMFLATLIEFVTAKIMIRFLGSLWWDYSEKPFNYKGILCLESSIAWGFYTIMMFGFLQKVIVNISNHIPRHYGMPIVSFILIAYGIDFMYHCWRAKGYSFDAIQESIQGNLSRIFK